VAHSLIDSLEARGVRLTRQRRVLADILDNVGRHVNAQDLLTIGKQRDSSINRATVYRTLRLLKQEGLIDELDLLHFEGEKHFYEPRPRASHVHVGCGRCGAVVELESGVPEVLAAEVRDRTGFEPDSIRIEVRAICPTCRNTP